MGILLWHGYLLGGTGSNVYTRQLAREWARAGHDVTVFCQEPRPELYDLGGAEVVRPDVGGLLPVFVLDRYAGYEVKLLQDCTRAGARQLGRGECGSAPRAASRRSRLLQPRPARRARRSRDGRALRGQGPRLGARVLDARAPGARDVGEGGARRMPRRCSSARTHIREVLEEVCGHVDRVHEVPPGVDVDEWRPRPRAEALAALARPRPRRDPPNPGERQRAPARTRRMPSDSRHSSTGERPTIVYFGKLLRNKGVHVLLEALRGLDARAVVVGFGDYRAELEALADPEHVLFTGPLEHRHLVHLLALADACVVPSIFPEAFGMVAAEAAAAGCPPLVARHSGLAEVAEGLEAEYPSGPPAPRVFPDGRCGRAAREAPRAARALAGERERRSRRQPAAPWSSVGAGRASPIACLEVKSGYGQRFHYCSAPMGDEQRLSADELIARSRAQFESATDFTVAVEEEFALVDPGTLDLTNRFEDVQAAAQGTSLEEHLVGELIASEVEVRTGRCETFADVPGVMAERRSQLAGARRADGAPPRRDGHASVGGLEGPAHHRHAALPAKRRAAPLRRLAQQHVRSACPRRDQRPRSGDRGGERAAQLPPGAPRALVQLAVRGERQLAGCTPRGRRSSPASSLAAASRTRSRPGTSTRASSASSTRPARSPRTRRSGGAFVRTWRSRPSRSGSATASPSSPRRSRSRHSRRRSPPASRARTTKASPWSRSRTG